jgi:hypothetical protein
MGEILSYSEMKQCFDAEWVLLENPETLDDLIVRSGKVLSHSKNRDEIYRKARELKPRHSAILFLGELPDDVAVVL